jgi:CMP-N,N'-diacetyllegionaminic acid synthase
MKILALINARGGSKGVPKKNIKPLMNKPLIAWSIQAGINSEMISDVVVSTDDQKIADIAKRYGADVPFLRPPELATDNSLQIDCIKHAVGYLENLGSYYNIIIILQPTVPLRTSKDIDGALSTLIESNVDSVISVCDVGGRHPVTCYKEKGNGLIQPLVKSDLKGVLRQKFGKVLWRNGAIYAMYRDIVMEKDSLYGDSTVGYLMPEERSFNIDSHVDWDLVEGYLLLKDKKKK